MTSPIITEEHRQDKGSVDGTSVLSTPTPAPPPPLLPPAQTTRSSALRPS
jgi:hypothetical protein